MKNFQSMKDLAGNFGNRLVPIRTGELCEVKILKILKNKILVDVGGLTLGFIPEQEFSLEIGDLKVSDKILAFVLSVENDEGYVVLSLRRADKEKITKILQEKLTGNLPLSIKVSDANKGGLICQFGDYEGFLPVSQLATSHYPKVQSGNREEILAKLKELVGQTLQAKILSFEPNVNKLIFSEKAAGDQAQQEKINKIQIGDVFDGEITGIVDFGLFVKIKISPPDEIEGLVHISEASWEHVDNLKNLFKVGQKIKVQVISRESNRISLSVKRLLPDPWKRLAESKKVGDQVEGEVTKITPFGAFVKAEGIDGLVHISEFGDKSKAAEKIEEGKKYLFKILFLESDLHKLNLTLKDIKGKKKTPKKKISSPKKAKKTTPAKEKGGKSK